LYPAETIIRLYRNCESTRPEKGTLTSGFIHDSIDFSQAGILATAFEKNAALFSPGERDWNTGPHWALPTLKSLMPNSAAAQLQSAQVDPNTPTKPIDNITFPMAALAK
jgi:hypothetical protein